MEKKRNQLTRNGGQSSDFKKDVSNSNKQHYRRRKESFQSEYSNSKQQQSNKFRSNNNNNNFYFDKRPPARKNGNGTDQQQLQQGNNCFPSGATARLTYEDRQDYELNSVFNCGSKKQNLNHLLNFHRYTKDSDGSHYRGAFSKHGYRHRVASKKYQYNKEQYLQANCQFIVKEDAKYDYKHHQVSPDALVEWDQIVKVLISSCEESQCPICLYPPKAAKMTKCGHIYCFSCMLHYLSLSDKAWRKCPICYESVYLSDLKSTTSRHNHHSYKVGDMISMELMNREKGSLFVNKANEAVHAQINEFPSFSSIQENVSFSKLILCNKREMLKIIEQEKYELDFQLAEDGMDCPESIFVQQAIDLLDTKRKDIETLITAEEAENSQHNVSQADKHQVNEASVTSSSVSTSETESIDDDSCNGSLIDEDCTLTVNDIDIASESSSVQSKHFFYYQAPNAQNIFLHAINSKMLQLTYGSLEHSPQTIRGKIVQIECCSMNEDLRKRLKYLQHLPVSTVFEVVELEFEPGIVSRDVIDVFKDDLLHRRKMRQRREREEIKREKAINEINDRQMGKMMRASANIDICSSSQFPEYRDDVMPALSSNDTDLSSSPADLPSFANMLTSPTGRESQKLWPSLASAPTSSNAIQSCSSFFRDSPQVMSKVASATLHQQKSKESEYVYDEDDEEEDEIECKAPAYKNSLSDALASALKSKASLSETKSANSSGKNNKKKGKKTLLFSSGLNFN